MGGSDLLKYEAELKIRGRADGGWTFSKLGFLIYTHVGGWKRGSVVLKIMLIEDSTSFRQVVKVSLQDQFPSMDIIEAADGVEAFQKIDSHPPNLMLMDISLPGENGLELTRKIKVDYPDVIIIILTSHDSPEYRGAAIQYKAGFFFYKGALTTEGVFTLVKSILLTKGFNADGSDRR